MSQSENAKVRLMPARSTGHLERALGNLMSSTSTGKQVAPPMVSPERDEASTRSVSLSEESESSPRSQFYLLPVSDIEVGAFQI
ncbi:MAG: hypothetical protein KDD44_08720, partial [Bdellovibrionales bacterium]|nr:hypothetical protein [Bdellovibrionales bacterium]